MYGRSTAAPQGPQHVIPHTKTVVILSEPKNLSSPHDEGLLRHAPSSFFHTLPKP
jgi:hypothetical protein